MNDLNRISVIVCTRDRPRDLTDLLQTLLNQTHPPFEVVVVDDSLLNTVKKVVDSFEPRFDDDKLRYVRGCGHGLPSARNLGVTISRGDYVLFLDDDTLLQNNFLHELATFLCTHTNAKGIQGQIRMHPINPLNAIRRRIENAIYKVLMLSYCKQNRLAVRRSGTSILPYFYSLTEKTNTERLEGYCMCYRRELFDELSFDTNLKGWGFMEDLDFSYRIHKKYPRTLSIIPHAVITHKNSTESRMPLKTRIYMTTIYWFYVFFKDILENSILNLIAFLWALTGNLVTNIGALLIRRKPRPEWWKIIYLLNSYFYALRHLKKIKRRTLDFFNKQFKI